MIDESVLKLGLTLMTVAIIAGVLYVGLAQYDFDFMRVITPSVEMPRLGAPSFNFVSYVVEGYNPLTLQVFVKFQVDIEVEGSIPVTLVEFRGEAYCADHGVKLGDFYLTSNVTINGSGRYEFPIAISLTPQGVDHVRRNHLVSSDGGDVVEVRVEVPEVKARLMVGSVNITIPASSGLVTTVRFTIPEEGFP
ncbi:MAG: hypothetical protein DRN61_00895 [Thaumarchaeota archaeon]|nr:MAG: hypothetical protein DRN61_00895 [Nitrososphaerota archaeon]